MGCRFSGAHHLQIGQTLQRLRFQGWPSCENISEFTYSKLHHFKLFRNQPFRSLNTGKPDPASCDLKVYQDYLVYCFLRLNLAPGSRILEVGGGDSRILKYFRRRYECWNIDKCEGLGNGPIHFTSSRYRMVYEYIGEFSPDLPDEYFDLVFSISALEHTPENPQTHARVADDIDRVLKPGGLSFHCFDIVVRPDGRHWVCGLIPHLYATREIVNPWVGPGEILNDPEAYFMSKAAYEFYWKPILGLPWEEMRFPLSYNLLWRRQ